MKTRQDPSSKESNVSKQDKLQALMAHLRGERECPECGKIAIHEDNGAAGQDLAWLCVACGTSWDEFPL